MVIFGLNREQLALNEIGQTVLPAYDIGSEIQFHSEYQDKSMIMMCYLCQLTVSDKMNVWKFCPTALAALSYPFF